MHKTNDTRKMNTRSSEQRIQKHTIVNCGKYGDAKMFAKNEMLHMFRLLHMCFVFDGLHLKTFQILCHPVYVKPAFSSYLPFVPFRIPLLFMNVCIRAIVHRKLCCIPFHCAHVFVVIEWYYNVNHSTFGSTVSTAFCFAIYKLYTNGKNGTKNGTRVYSPSHTYPMTITIVIQLSMNKLLVNCAMPRL